MSPRWQDTRVAPDRTHHLLGREPLYAARFIDVLSFHEPGLAAVRDVTGAHHIKLDGTAAYERRFKRTFGFYEGRAAVEDQSGAHHIDVEGNDISPRRFAWCGNFQGGACTVRGQDGKYFHVGADGAALYPERWNYAGDFREGAAVVMNEKGLHHHIDIEGRNLGLGEFIDLDVFHKGYARARDDCGWTHIDVHGRPAYDQRFAAVEPFYDGQARVERFDGTLEVVDEQGATLVELRPPPHAEPIGGRILDRSAWGRVHLVTKAGDEPVIVKWTRADNDREVQALLALQDVPGVPRLLGRRRFDMNDQLRLQYCGGDVVGQPRKLRARLEPEAIRITIAVLGICERMHALGWVHSDIHPGNVLVGDVVTLLDYACAVRAGPARPWRGEINWGVWEYVPPEQLADHGELDSSADVYSAACLCLAMVIGAPPVRVAVQEHFKTGGWDAVRSAFRTAGPQAALKRLSDPLRCALEPALSNDRRARPSAEALQEALLHV